MFTLVDSSNYQSYLENKDIRAEWKERDFTTEVRRYLDSSLQKVMIVSGLRGTGKSVGLLQIMKDYDAVYLLAEKGMEQTTADEIGKAVKNRTEKVIILDEYTWIKNREENDLDAYLDALTNHGKKVIITGTESISLEALKSGSLIHRALTVHTTHMSFSEFCRLYDLPMNQKNCDAYLTHGGIFEDYVINNEETMKDYIENAIIQNLKSYVRKGTSLIDENKIGTIIYTLFYKAIWNIVKKDITFDSSSIASLEAMERLGIDPDNRIVKPSEVELVARVLENVGVLVRIPNLFPRKEELESSYISEDYRTYITNPSLTWQFLNCVFPDYKDRDGRIGFVYEASCMVDLAMKKRAADRLYFIEHSQDVSYEIDLVVVQNDDSVKKRFFLFDCKHAAEYSIYNKNISLVNGRADDAILGKWPDSEIVGRYIVHPGADSVQTNRNGTEVLVINQDKCFYQYYDYEENRKLCSVQNRKKDAEK